MPTTCDIIERGKPCKKRAFHVLEDMSDGEFIDVCGRHFRVLITKGGYKPV